MRVAIVTPLPPQHTGIADYASDLIVGLKNNGLSIDLFSNAGIDSFEDLKVYHIEKIDLDILKEYDVILYQMGNNIHFHLYMVDMIKKYGGIIHLHDMVLHHTFAWITIAQEKRLDYFNMIEKWYGYEVRKLLEEMVDNHAMPWESRIVTQVPLFEEVIQYADACIVHSDFVKSRIKARFPHLDTYKVEQLYLMDKKEEEASKSSTIRFGIFGGVDPQKRVDVALDAFHRISKKLSTDKFHLNIVGGIDERCNYITELPKKYSLEDSVNIAGRVDEEAFMALFENTDILIALRYPTMGETSAVVMRAMQLGIPCIVNDIGWYAELPEHVIKIPVDTMEKDLEKTLLNLLEDENAFKDLKKQSLKYSKEVLNFEKVIEGYSKVINSAHQYVENKLIYRRLGNTLKDLEFLDDPAIYTPVIDRLETVFQAPDSH